jgi:hypothetical protein
VGFHPAVTLRAHRGDVVVAAEFHLVAHAAPEVYEFVIRHFQQTAEGKEGIEFLT